MAIRGVPGRTAIQKALALADRVYALARGSIVLEASTSETDLPLRLEHADWATTRRRLSRQAEVPNSSRKSGRRKASRWISV